jgi:hypothetical protein
MKTLSKVAHSIAWLFAFLQIAVLLRACLYGFNDSSVGLALASLVGFFVFLSISTVTEQPKIAVRTRVRNG